MSKQSSHIKDSKENDQHDHTPPLQQPQQHPNMSSIYGQSPPMESMFLLNSSDSLPLLRVSGSDGYIFPSFSQPFVDQVNQLATQLQQAHSQDPDSPCGDQFSPQVAPPSPMSPHMGVPQMLTHKPQHQSLHQEPMLYSMQFPAQDQDPLELQHRLQQQMEYFASLSSPQTSSEEEPESPFLSDDILVGIGAPDYHPPPQEDIDKFANYPLSIKLLNEDKLKVIKWLNSNTISTRVITNNTQYGDLVWRISLTCLVHNGLHPIDIAKKGAPNQTSEHSGGSLYIKYEPTKTGDHDIKIKPKEFTKHSWYPANKHKEERLFRLSVSLWDSSKTKQLSNIAFMTSNVVGKKRNSKAGAPKIKTAPKIETPSPPITQVYDTTLSPLVIPTFDRKRARESSPSTIYRSLVSPPPSSPVEIPESVTQYPDFFDGGVALYRLVPNKYKATGGEKSLVLEGKNFDDTTRVIIHESGLGFHHWKEKDHTTDKLILLRISVPTEPTEWKVGVCRYAGCVANCEHHLLPLRFIDPSNWHLAGSVGGGGSGEGDRAGEDDDSDDNNDNNNNKKRKTTDQSRFTTSTHTLASTAFSMLSKNMGPNEKNIWGSVAFDALISSLSVDTPAIVVLALSIVLWSQAKIEKQLLLGLLSFINADKGRAISDTLLFKYLNANGLPGAQKIYNIYMKQVLDAINASSDDEKEDLSEDEAEISDEDEVDEEQTTTPPIKTEELLKPKTEPVHTPETPTTSHQTPPLTPDPITSDDSPPTKKTITSISYTGMTRHSRAMQVGVAPRHRVFMALPTNPTGIPSTTTTTTTTMEIDSEPPSLQPQQPQQQEQPQSIVKQELCGNFVFGTAFNDDVIMKGGEYTLTSLTVGCDAKGEVVTQVRAEYTNLSTNEKVETTRGIVQGGVVHGPYSITPQTEITVWASDKIHTIQIGEHKIGGLVEDSNVKPQKFSCVVGLYGFTTNHPIRKFLANIGFYTKPQK